MNIEHFPGMYPGTISGAPDVAALMRAANLVCRCTILGVAPAGEVIYDVRGEPVLFHRRIASARLADVRAGIAEAGGLIEVEFLLPDVPAALTTLTEGEDVVLFLTGGGGRYRLTDFASSKLPA